MTNSEKKYLGLLKDKIVACMQKTYPGIPNSISRWKGQHIVDFQSDLNFKQKQHLSEKWFYTHMKSENEKLPRIDVLNFLSQYVGYQNWDTFKHSHTDKELGEKGRRKTYFVPLFAVVTVTLLYLVFISKYTEEYTFCFYDSVSKEAISNTIIEITLLNDNESNRNYLCDADGCFLLKTPKNKVAFVVETPYYYSDTIVRRLNSFNRSEDIKLEVDNYAILIHYFSNNKVKDWVKRRDDLNEIFSDNAKIYQVYKETVGMEIYNKWEFINKLTLPTSSLNDIRILDTQYKNEQITHLCFIQNSTDQ